MPDALTYWRKTNRLTSRCTLLGMGDTHAVADHRGDFVTYLPAGFAAETSDADRTDFALVIITDIPTAVAAKLKRWLKKPSLVGTPPDETVDRPRTIHLDVDLLKAEYPTQAAAIDKLFDPARTLAVSKIPSFTWTKFRLCVWDKINLRVVPEAQWEEDPDG